jgi:hypothetical protein
MASATLSASADSADPRPRHCSCGSGLLGRLCGCRARAGLPANAGTDPRLRQDRGRRDGGAGASIRDAARPSWAVARDDRPWSGSDPPAGAYTYAPGRGAVHALELLEGYRGVVQCDGYAAYKAITGKAGGEAITLAFCWAHVRRQFYDIEKDAHAPVASEALGRIAKIYAIEKTIRGRSAEERRSVRQERSKPLVLDLKSWFEHQLTRLSGKSKTAEAIRHCTIGKG